MADANSPADFPAALPVLDATATGGSPSPYGDNNRQAAELLALLAKIGVDESEDQASLDFRIQHLKALMTLSSSDVLGLGVDWTREIDDSFRVASRTVTNGAEFRKYAKTSQRIRLAPGSTIVIEGEPLFLLLKGQVIENGGGATIVVRDMPEGQYGLVPYASDIAFVGLDVVNGGTRPGNGVIGGNPFDGNLRVAFRDCTIDLKDGKPFYLARPTDCILLRTEIRCTSLDRPTNLDSATRMVLRDVTIRYRAGRPGLIFSQFCEVENLHLVADPVDARETGGFEISYSTDLTIDGALIEYTRRGGLEFTGEMILAQRSEGGIAEWQGVGRVTSYLEETDDKKALRRRLDTDLRWGADPFYFPQQQRTKRRIAVLIDRAGDAVQWRFCEPLMEDDGVVDGAVLLDAPFDPAPRPGERVSLCSSVVTNLTVRNVVARNGMTGMLLFDGGLNVDVDGIDLLDTGPLQFQARSLDPDTDGPTPEDPGRFVPRSTPNTGITHAPLAGVSVRNVRLVNAAGWREASVIVRSRDVSGTGLPGSVSGVTIDGVQIDGIPGFDYRGDKDGIAIEAVAEKQPAGGVKAAQRMRGVTVKNVRGSGYLLRNDLTGELKTVVETATATAIAG